MVIIDNSKYDEAIKKIGNANSGRLPWNLDMFKNAEDIIADYGYAIVQDDNGTDIAVLCWNATSYLHDYAYTGEIDTEFLDDYDILFLHDCNEFSVELCRTGLQHWKGHTLVLLGENWQFAVDDLPELEGKNCIWQDKLLADFFSDITKDSTYLHVVTGDPHEEPMDRYNEHVMLYDEVMTFTYFFANKLSPGKLNPDKKFLVFDAHYGYLGIFNVFNKSLACMKYVAKKGFIPVPKITDRRGPLGIYQNTKADDFWAMFYEYPEDYKLEEVFRSQNVYAAPFFYNGSIMTRLMNDYGKDISFSWPGGKYNKLIRNYISEREDRFLPYPEKTLGVLARGTDYVNTHLANHNIHASKEMICEKIDSALNEWNLEYIYLATEDASYCEFFKERYGDKIFFTDQERFTVKEGQLLGDLHRDSKNKRPGFLLGAEYILSITLLSRCNSLIASGGCAGVGEAIKMNEGQYKNTFVFNLGKN